MATNQVVIAFVLPKALPGSPEQQVRALSAASFQRSECLGYVHARREKQMHVIRHNDPGMQVVVSPLSAVFA